jgi:ParB/RepB/Spo0J family partition protein
MNRLENIPLDSIQVGTQARTVFGDLSELRESIRASGLIHPISVYPLGERYKLISGERRYRCFRILREETGDYRTIPSLVLDVSDEATILILQGAENEGRLELHWLESARHYEMMRKQGFSQTEICEKLGKKKNFVHYRLKALHELAPEIVETLEQIRQNRGSDEMGQRDLPLKEALRIAALKGAEAQIREFQAWQGLKAVSEPRARRAPPIPRSTVLGFLEQWGSEMTPRERQILRHLMGEARAPAFQSKV